MKNILLVEDDKIQRTILRRMVQDEGFEVDVAEGGAEALTFMAGPQGSTIDLVLLDLVMPVVGGMEVLARLRQTRPSLPVIILTSHSETDRVVEVMRAGAADFLPKPVTSEKLRHAIENALKFRHSASNEPQARRRGPTHISFENIVGSSAATLQAIRMAQKGAASNVPILIEGESGVGKEMFARAIQSASDRADKPFIAVNCGAIPANLVESILFGHEKGAFTGASEKHDGKFQEADGGTLFLDEIGELPLETQVKLLRAIQEGVVDPVGGRSPVEVDIRLISATNKTLIEQVGQGKFREDLMYRLNVFPVRIPSLRERREDIPLLVEHFVKAIATSEKRPVRPLSSEALALLKSYDWPGNVRQLENAMFRAVILADGDSLTPEDFPQVLNALTKTDMIGVAVERTRPFLAHANEPAPVVSPSPEETVVIFDDKGELRPLCEVEAEVIEKALTYYHGHMSEIARRLGIGRSTLYRKITDLGLEGSLPATQRGGGM